MFSEPSKEFLYSCFKIYTEHSDGNKTISGTTTGFMLNIAKSTPWIITNRHVIDLNYKKPTNKYKDFKLSKFLITGRTPDDHPESSLQLHENTKFYFHDKIENDIVIIRANFEPQNEGMLRQWYFSMPLLADEKVFKKINPFDLVCYSGFPKIHDKFNNRPILRSGHIASDPNYSYSWDSNYQGDCIAYEGFSSEGASGSPIIAPARGMLGIRYSRREYLIGVNAGHIPDQNGHSEYHTFTSQL